MTYFTKKKKKKIILNLLLLIIETLKTASFALHVDTEGSIGSINNTIIILMIIPILL